MTAITKKLLTLTVALLACLLVFTACNDDGVPDGMKSVTLEGEPFILYVPEDWSDNRASGISSAHFGLNVVVSARYYTPEDANATLDDYVAAYLEECKQSYENFSFTRKDSSLGKNNPAARIEYDFTTGEASATKAVQYIALHGGDALMLSFYCESKAFDEYAEEFEKIRSEFVLATKSVKNDTVTDKKTPEGMKIASSDDLNYVFYAPEAWITDLSDQHSYAYYPESGRPNVSVTAYTPSELMTAEQYFEFCEEDYKEHLQGYELLGSDERAVSDRDAISYTYKTVYGGDEIFTMQTVLVYNDLLYSITYTARAERFEEHLGDVEKMLDEFRFR